MKRTLLILLFFMLAKLPLVPVAVRLPPAPLPHPIWNGHTNQRGPATRWYPHGYGQRDKHDLRRAGHDDGSRRSGYRRSPMIAW